VRGAVLRRARGDDPGFRLRYTYGYATLGELPAWIIGWDLILEYMVGACLVSIGWSPTSSTCSTTCCGRGTRPAEGADQRPLDWSDATHRFVTTGAWINLPAVLVLAVLTIVLVRGIRESSNVNVVIVIAKLAVILFFILLAVWHVNPATGSRSCRSASRA